MRFFIILATLLIAGLLSPATRANPAQVIPVATKTNNIVVAHIFGDIKKQLQNKVTETINKPAETGVSRFEPTTLPVTQNSYLAQAEDVPPQTRQSKKQTKRVGAGPALPPLPFIERDKEGDFYAGKWRILKPFPLYAKEGGGTVIKTLPKGLKLDGLSLAEHTLSFAMAEIKEPITLQFPGEDFNQATQQRELFTLSLQRGDKIAYTSYFGEGECRVWVKGRTYVLNCFGGGAERTHADDELERHAHYSGKIKTTHWALVRTPDGAKGWLWLKDADFKSIQGISRHGDSVE